MNDSRFYVCLALSLSLCSLLPPSLPSPPFSRSLNIKRIVPYKIKLCCFGTHVFHMADFHEKKNVVIID